MLPNIPDWVKVRHGRVRGRLLRGFVCSDQRCMGLSGCGCGDSCQGSDNSRGVSCVHRSLGSHRHSQLLLRVLVLGKPPHSARTKIYSIWSSPFCLAASKVGAAHCRIGGDDLGSAPGCPPGVQQRVPAWTSMCQAVRRDSTPIV